MDVILIERQAFETMQERFEAAAKRIEVLSDKYGKTKELNQWLDNLDVCRMLDISKRTLQTYRDNGTLPYTQIGYKMYYKPEDVEKLIVNPKKQNHE